MKTHDPVNHPTHYNKGGIEVIDIIEAYGMNFRLSNVIKYVLRHKDKGNPIEDLEKALFYLKRDIDKKKAVLANKVKKETLEAQRKQDEEYRKGMDTLLKGLAQPPSTCMKPPDTLWTVEVYAVTEEQ